MFLFSVIIPMYNKVKYIERALNSVLAQTISDFEVIVVDDGSIDGSVEVVASFNDPRIRLIRQENSGVSAARNKGIVLSNTEMVAFLDADDDWEPTFLETILDLNKKYPHAGTYVTAHRVEYTEGVFVQSDFQFAPSDKDGGLIDSFLCCPYIYSSAIAVKRSVLQSVGAFPVGIKYGEDLDTWIRLAMKAPIAWSPKTCSTSRSSEALYNCRSKTCVGDAPFAKTVMSSRECMPYNEWQSLYELLCSQRLRIFALGTYLAGYWRESRHMVLESLHTKRELRRLAFMLLLTSIPPYIGRFIWRSITGNKDISFLSVDGSLPVPNTQNLSQKGM